MSKSIISNERECLVCHTTYNIHKHHIYMGVANRPKADKDGCWCYLCYRHHNGSNQGVHFNKTLDLKLKRLCQKAYMKTYNASVEDFIERYGKNYL